MSTVGKRNRSPVSTRVVLKITTGREWLRASTLQVPSEGEVSNETCRCLSQARSSAQPRSIRGESSNGANERNMSGYTMPPRHIVEARGGGVENILNPAAIKLPVLVRIDEIERADAPSRDRTEGADGLREAIFESRLFSCGDQAGEYARGPGGRLDATPAGGDDDGRILVNAGDRPKGVDRGELCSVGKGSHLEVVVRFRKLSGQDQDASEGSQDPGCDSGRAEMQAR